MIPRQLAMSMCPALRREVGEAHDELHRMLSEDELREAIVLVFANKQVRTAPAPVCRKRARGRGTLGRVAAAACMHHHPARLALLRESRLDPHVL